MQQAIILCPFYKDEESFNVFSTEVEKAVASIDAYKFSFLLVNDGTDVLNLVSRLPIEIIHLHRNTGHQKAIAIGLAHAHHNLEFQKIVIMDCDGEDNPEDISRLLKESTQIVVAKRMSRQEGRKFKFFYRLYKLFFFLLVGKKISFGNFMCLSKSQVTKLVYYSELWDHLAGAIIKSKLPYTSINAHRGKRYRGQSKMNFTSLVLHGLGAMGVFVEIIVSRILIFSFLMMAIGLFAIAFIFYIKYFTNKAIPGWATTTISSMLIVILQSFLLSLFHCFFILIISRAKKIYSCSSLPGLYKLN
jgi:polyisoprenyl-phosphate glycosyltransferase